MKKKCSEDLQRQLTSLIPIIEPCLSLTAEIELTKNKLALLPREVESLKKQANCLDRKSAQNNVPNSSTKLQEMEFKLDSLVDDLETVFVSLATFDNKLKNVVALKEKLEAVQEERIDKLTPERIYKLLEKQKRSPGEAPILLSELDNKILSSNSGLNIKQKVINFFGDRFCKRKTAVCLTIVASLFVGWFAGYQSSTNVRLDNNEAIEKSQELDNSSVDL